MSYRENFVGTQKRVRIIHGKRAIRVRAIEVTLYVRKISSWRSLSKRAHDAYTTSH